MYNSIKHLANVSINIFDDLETELFKNPTAFAEYVMGIRKELNRIGTLRIQDALEGMNQMLFDSGKRKEKWSIEKHVKK